MSTKIKGDGKRLSEHSPAELHALAERDGKTGQKARNELVRRGIQAETVTSE